MRRLPLRSKTVAQAAEQGFRVSLLLLLPDTHYAIYFNWLAKRRVFFFAPIILSDPVMTPSTDSSNISYIVFLTISTFFKFQISESNQNLKLKVYRQLSS